MARLTTKAVQDNAKKNVLLAMNEVLTNLGGIQTGDFSIAVPQTIVVENSDTEVAWVEMVLTAKNLKPTKTVPVPFDAEAKNAEWLETSYNRELEAKTKAETKAKKDAKNKAKE